MVGDCLVDVVYVDDVKGCFMDVWVDEVVIVLFFLFVGVQEVFGFGDVVCSCYYQGLVEVSGGFVEYIGCIGGYDVGFCGGSNIDVVVVYGYVVDCFQLWIGGEQCGCYWFVWGGEEVIFVIGFGQQLIGVVDVVVLVGFDFEMLFQVCQDFREDGVGDEDFGFYVGFVVLVLLLEESGGSIQKNKKFMMMNSGIRMFIDYVMQLKKLGMWILCFLVMVLIIMLGVLLIQLLVFMKMVLVEMVVSVEVSGFISFCVLLEVVLKNIRQVGVLLRKEDSMFVIQKYIMLFGLLFGLVMVCIMVVNVFCLFVCSMVIIGVMVRKMVVKSLFIFSIGFQLKLLLVWVVFGVSYSDSRIMFSSVLLCSRFCYFSGVFSILVVMFGFYRLFMSIRLIIVFSSRKLNLFFSCSVEFGVGLSGWCFLWLRQKW